MLSELEAKAEQHHQNRNEESTHHWWSESAEVKLMLVGPQSPKQNCWLVGWLDGWMDGWMVGRLTAVAVVHRHNLHQQISGSAPETSLLPSPPASGGLL